MSAWTEAVIHKVQVRRALRFMSWPERVSRVCPSCAAIADGFHGAVVNHRDSRPDQPCLSPLANRSAASGVHENA
jgi:hypothetical protein